MTCNYGHLACASKGIQVFRDPEIRQVMEKENIKLIKWRNLRDLQRID